MKACPSSTCSEGSVLLGKVKSDGTVGFLSTKFELDMAAVEEFEQLGDPELYYRFSSPCAQKGCKQWDDSTGSCTVIKRILAVGMDLPNNLPTCLIRKTCRWYHQEGAAACKVCPLVLTDMSEAEI